jgi:putative copper export protein
MLGVLALGWYNWRIVTPALEGRAIASADRLRLAIRLELALGLLMLIITTMLVVSPLPGEG